MWNPEIAKVADEVKVLRKEVDDTKRTLEQIRNEGSVWTSEWREKIVRKCLEAIEPKMVKFLSKFNSLADTLKRLWAVEETTPIKEEFINILSMVESALANMESYGNETDKTKARNLCTLIRNCQSKLA